MQNVIRVLKPGAVFIARVDPSINMKQQCLYAGMTNIQSKNEGQLCVVAATKPSWKQGSAAPLRKTKPQETKASSWQLLDLTNEVELADEDDLLNDDVTVKRSAKKQVFDDCGENGLPTRKACKNCTCGRAEVEAAGADLDTFVPPPSGCGSCGLGDAFRCSTCPFLGMGTFAKDQKPPIPTKSIGNAVMLDL
jgi:hypothetical protein